MLTPAGSFHHSKLPDLGDIVVVKIRSLMPGHRLRKFIVDSFPLCDSADYHFSLGIHTVNLRALDNRARVRVSGFYCERVD